MGPERTKILAIDDNQDNLISLKALISDAFPDAVILTALNGKTGLELAAVENPDVILLDIVMPDMDGFDVCRKLKTVEALCDIPVVFVTALKGDRESRIHALECGAEAFLAKPIDETELTAQIRAMMKIRIANLEKRDEKVRLFALVREQTRELNRTNAATLRLLEELKVENEARRLSEDALRKSEERHRTILRTAMDGIWLFDIEGHLLEVNESYSRMSGYSAQELLTMNIFDLDVSGYPDGDSSHIRDAMEQGESRFETRHRRKDGSIFDVEVGAQYRVEGDNGHIVAFLRDITGRKLAEKERNELQAHMIQQDKMASIGQLAAGVAHEINNPVGFIKSNLETLVAHADKLTRYIGIVDELVAGESISGMRDALEEKRSRLHVDFVVRDCGLILTECMEGVTRITNIVKDMRVFAHHGTVEPMFLDINHCCDTVISLIWNEIRYVATLHKEYGTIPPLLCNPQQISQVLMNLIANAAHAITDQGEITIQTREYEGSVFISISDTGYGIPPENISKIFEAFYTTKDVGKGTGLGLSISSSIICNHGGEISVKSKLGVGSTFTVRLPLKRPYTEPSEIMS